MAEITVNLSWVSGAVDLPDAGDFSGEMFDDYQEVVERLQKKRPGLSKLVHLNAFACAEWVAKGHGTWDLDGVTLDEFRGWAEDRKAERTQLVSVIGRGWARYFSDIIDPNG